MNNELQKNLTDFEKKNLADHKRLFDEDSDPAANERKFVWDFGYLHNQVVITRPRIITLSIQNKGGTTLDWRIKDRGSSNAEDEDMHMEP